MKHINTRSRKILAMLMSSVLLVSGMIFPHTATPNPVTAESYTYSTLDVRDVLMLLLSSTPLDSPMAGHEDVNEDGYINTADARFMLQSILKGTNSIELNEPVAENAFRLSSISDLTDSNGSRSYDVYAPYDDTYTLNCSKAKSITIYSGEELIASGNTSLTATLKADVGYTLTIATTYGNTSFSLITTAVNHNVTLPYEVAEPIDTSGYNLNNNSAYTVAASNLNYKPREGGTYIYCNNPEQIDSNAIGKAFIQDKGLSGEVYVTFEHSNISGRSVYLGYQVKNEGSTDVYVTITNVGYQNSGSWYGQKAWYDFYNTSFCLPSDFFSNPSKYGNNDYLFENYTPRVYQPMTYRLPAGESFYVVGGTTSDAYRNINVDGTANLLVGSSKCANGIVKFNVTGGEVTGTLYAYTSTSQVAAAPAENGYRVDTNYNTGESYGLQYKGSAPHSGVIDSYLTWCFNDEIGAGMLPVSYTNSYASASNIAATTTPYAAYNSQSHTYSRALNWATHINPQNVNTAVGTDMVKFECVDTSGVSRIIDNDHADGTGNPANTANWMIEYQEHFTLVNQGNKERKIILSYQDNGALAILVRDSQTGNVIQADLSVGGHYTGYNYTYTITVPAHSVKQITMDYLLMPMSAGTVTHMVTIS